MSRHHYWTSEEQDAHKQGHEDERYGRRSFEHNCRWPENEIDKAYCEGRTDERREREEREAEERRIEEEREYQRREEIRRQELAQEEEYYREMEEEARRQQEEEEEEKSVTQIQGTEKEKIPEKNDQDSGN